MAAPGSWPWGVILGRAPSFGGRFQVMMMIEMMMIEMMMIEMMMMNDDDDNDDDYDDDDDD